jgi:photosystem II stability/assembly factor-like uncharacterized protein
MPEIPNDLYGIAGSEDGKTLLAVGAGGGIFRSTDGGSSWEPENTKFQNELQSVAEFSDGKTALAVGYGGLILRSADGGVDWNQVTSGGTGYLWVVKTFGDGETALAVGNHGTILRSMDKGRSWTTVQSPATDWLDAIGISKDGTVVLAAGADGGMLRSTDQGKSWTQIETGDPAGINSITILPDDKTVFAAADRGTIFSSDDGGLHWTHSKPVGPFNLFGAAVFADQKTVLAVGESSKVLRSTDAGKTWTEIDTETNSSLTGIEITANGQTAFAVGIDGTILRSTDTGKSWQSESSGGALSFYSTGFFANGRIALTVGGQGTILRSVDSGASWEPQISGIKNDLYFVTALADNKTVLAFGNDGSILRSEDAGRSWSNTGNWAKNGLLFGSCFRDGKTLLAVGAQGTIIGSNDGGVHWTQRNSGVASDLYGVGAFADDQTALAVGANGTILRSADAGQTWTPVSSGSGTRLNSVAFGGDGKTALAVGNYGLILRSADTGLNWGQIKSPTNEDVESVLVLANGKTALAVTGGGLIFRSTDIGASWAPVTLDVNATLNSIGLSPDGRSVLAVGDDTILRSADGGATWTQVSYRRGLPRVAWGAWGAGLLMILVGFTALPPDKPRELDIAQLLATDRPLRKGDKDATGDTDALAAQITRFLQHVQTAPPFTIAVTGEWGSGKSSVLGRLKDRLEDGGQRPVWFNAWHRQGEESLFAALLQAVRRQAVPPFWSRGGMRVRWRFLVARVAASPIRWILALVVLGVVVDFAWHVGGPSWSKLIGALEPLPKDESGWLAALGVLGKTALWPVAAAGGLLMGVAGLRDRLSSAGLDPGRLLAGVGRATRWRDLGVQLAFRDRFKEALSEVTDALGSQTLTIIIDDLDRCRPTQIAEVLEAINFLSDSDGCFVVFGYAPQQVLAGVGLANREIAAELRNGEDTAAVRLAYATDYLRKLIQIEVPVPSFHKVAMSEMIDLSAKLSENSGYPRWWKQAAIGIIALGFIAAAVLGENYVYNCGNPVPQSVGVVTTQTSSIAATGTPLGATAGGTAGATTAAPVSHGGGANTVAPVPEVMRTSQHYYYPGQVPGTPEWEWLALLAALGLAGAAVFQEMRRPVVNVETDKPEFSKALRHWAPAIYEVWQSPREMKRFLNRLRFVAAGEQRHLRDEILVGLAALAQAEAKPSQTAEVVANTQWNNTGELRGKLESVSKSKALAEALLKAMDTAELLKAGLLPFNPTRDDVSEFSRLWERVQVESRYATLRGQTGATLSAAALSDG